MPFIILILIVVFIHEYGHYFAKKYGVELTDFSIGLVKVLDGMINQEPLENMLDALGGYVKFLVIEMSFLKQIKKN